MASSETAKEARARREAAEGGRAQGSGAAGLGSLSCAWIAAREEERETSESRGIEQEAAAGGEIERRGSG